MCVSIRVGVYIDFTGGWRRRNWSTIRQPFSFFYIPIHISKCLWVLCVRVCRCVTTILISSPSSFVLTAINCYPCADLSSGGCYAAASDGFYFTFYLTLSLSRGNNVNSCSLPTDRFWDGFSLTKCVLYFIFFFHRKSYRYLHFFASFSPLVIPFCFIIYGWYTHDIYLCMRQGCSFLRFPYIFTVRQVSIYNISYVAWGFLLLFQ